MEDSSIRLCGRMRVRLAGRDVELPRRQGRIVFAYLACARGRAVPRDELFDLLWPSDPPYDPGEVLSALLSRMRRVVGPGVIEGRRDLVLVLPGPSSVDLEEAHDAAELAEVALATGAWRASWEAAGRAAGIAADGFMSGDDAAWIEDRRRDVEALRVRALETLARAGIALRGPELSGAERAAREVVRATPFAESGHRLLMEALAARGDVAEALRAYERLRVLLRDELGTPPGPGVQELHRRLLAGELQPAAAPAPPSAEPEPVSADVPEPPADERKLVTVLCVEPAPPGDPADPEELRAALSEVTDRLRAVVERFGGAMQGPAPAAALFGAAAAHEDDAERAIRAALAACERGDARRAAVASGEAIVAGAERSATGQVVARASALLAQTPSGRVRVDEETARAARMSVEFEPAQGGALVRGLRDRIRRPTPAAPFIGRERELATLAELHGTVVDRGSPLLVTLAGQAGIGKTRLALEFARQVEADGATVYQGRCLPYGERIAFWPLREILCEAAHIELDDGAKAARHKLRALAAPMGLDDSTATALAASAGITLDEPSLEGAAPSDIAEQIGLAWPRFLTARALQGSLVLLIEDLHWAERALLVTLERIVARSQGPLMVLATTRPELTEWNQGWSSHVGMSRIALDSLSGKHARELAAELLPRAGERLREQVVELAEGNPFFAEEIARHLGAGDAPAASLPHGLRALVAARIDALPLPEKRALQHAAVVGRRFWLSALEPNETGRPLSALLGSLEERGLVMARPDSALPGESEYSFAHGLTREVAYRSIPRAARSRTHAAVGTWIERLAGDRREEFIYLLAYHYEAAASLGHADQAWPDDPKAGERVRAAAVHALLEAGAAARRGLMSGDPIGLAERALALARGDQERLAALDLHARALHAEVRADDALAAYLAALELARSLGDQPAAARLRAHAALLCTRYAGAFADDSWIPTARALVAEGLAETGEQDATFDVGALLLGRSWGQARWRDAGPRDAAGARRDVDRAVEIAERIDSHYLLTHALDGLTWLVLQEGSCEAEAMGDRLERAAGSLPNRVEAHESLTEAAICFARAGRFDRARRAAAETTRQAIRMSPHRGLHAGAAEVVALAPTGRLAELLEATARMDELAEAEGERICSTGLLALSGRVLALAEAGEARETERVLALLWRLGPSAGTFRTFAHPAAELLRPVLGREHTSRFIDDADRRDHTGDTVNRLRATLPVLAAGEGAGELRRTIAQARAVAGPACAPALGWIADLAEAAAWAREGRMDQATEQAEAASAALDRHGERYTAARLLAELLPLLRGPHAVELAQRTRAGLLDIGALKTARLLATSNAAGQQAGAP